MLWESGRDAEAAEVARTGVAVADAGGLARTLGGHTAALGAASLFAQGRWDEADAQVTRTLDADPTEVFAIFPRLLGAQIAAARGELATAKRHLSLAHSLNQNYGANQGALLARRGGIPLAEAKPEPEPPAVDAASRLKLTPRETEVLRLVADGWTNRKIATSLFITEKTASVHVSRILGKLGAADRGEAAALAHKLRLFDDNPHADPPA